MALLGSSPPLHAAISSVPKCVCVRWQSVYVQESCCLVVEGRGGARKKALESASGAQAQLCHCFSRKKLGYNTALTVTLCRVNKLQALCRFLLLNWLVAIYHFERV